MKNASLQIEKILPMIKSYQIRSYVFLKKLSFLLQGRNSRFSIFN